MAIDLRKPAKGSALLQRRMNRRAVVAAEQKEMRAALTRDGRKCRFPRCEVRDLPIDPCHLQHRGMGGNPKGDRTTRQTIITLCAKHHQLYDSGELLIKPLTKALFDGPCEFSLQIMPGSPYTFLCVTPLLSVGGGE